MPRVKKSENLTEENEKLSNEIAKAEARNAEAKAKMKENTERIQKEHMSKITNSGFTLDEVVMLVQTMAEKKVSVQDILSLIQDDPAENSKSTEENEKASEGNNELNKIMASLPSYD